MNIDLQLLNEIICFDSPKCTLQLKYIDTPIGFMFSLSDNDFLYLLEFVDKTKIVSEIQNLQLLLKAEIAFGDSYINMLLKNELDSYFAGNLKNFSIPVYLSGSDFQNNVWRTLMTIPYGETVSYKDIAFEIGSPKAMRAVGNSNGMNKIPIVVPCHRVISSNGKIGGYSGGIEKKKFLLELEKRFSFKN